MFSIQSEISECIFHSVGFLVLMLAILFIYVCICCCTAVQRAMCIRRQSSSSMDEFWTMHVHTRVSSTIQSIDGTDATNPPMWWIIIIKCLCRYTSLKALARTKSIIIKQWMRLSCNASDEVNNEIQTLKDEFIEKIMFFRMKKRPTPRNAFTTIFHRLSPTVHIRMHLLFPFLFTIAVQKVL